MPVTYHWLLTMQRGNGTTLDSTTMDGTVTPAPGATRREVFHDAVGELLRTNPHMRGGVVVFFALEPDEL